MRQSQASSTYLGSVVFIRGFEACDILHSALARLKPVWNDRSISLSSKIRLMHSLVTFKFRYACESWTLTAQLQRRIQTMEMRCYRKILRISFKDLVTNEEICAKRRKLKRYGHVSRSPGLAKTISQGTVKGGRRQSRLKKRWEDNATERTGLEFAKSQRAVENRKMEETGGEVICAAPTNPVVKG